ncbi:amidohydrolase family protein [Oribacterium sp. HCP28S3_H8]|uniref:amidohydrolase family protein n=1 Tax=Oribacterium sp. HCP28S3_H8 TaxID=3438945 RepID=UPI003F8985EE
MDKILIQNGTVYDPTEGTFVPRDIAVYGHCIVPAGSIIADILIDATGCIITPGLIDFHLHCFTGGSDGACDADTFCLPNGVTTCIDAGTAGSAAFQGFYANVISRARTRVLAMLHVAPEGLITGRHPENQTPGDWDIETIESLCDRYPEIVALKIRQGHAICDPYGLTDEPVIEGVKLAEKLKKKVVVHVNNPNVSAGRIASELRAGDVFCHMYAGTDENILDEKGKVQREIVEARKRGVIFDACNGRSNFLFRVAEAAISEGFMPDIISSDNSPLGNYRHPLISLPRLLSKYLMLGMRLEEVFDCATINPARWLGRLSLASLQPGTESDIAIWKLKNKSVLHKDFIGEARTGNQVLIPEMTIRDGAIAYSQADFL